MTREKNRYEAEFGSQRVTIISDKSKNHLDRVVDIVKEGLTKVSQNRVSSSREMDALLVALNAVSDNLDLKDQLDQLKQKYQELQSSMSEQAEANLKLLDENNNLKQEVDRKKAADSQTQEDSDKSSLKHSSEKDKQTARKSSLSSKTSDRSSVSKGRNSGSSSSTQQGLSKTPRS